MKSGIKDLCAFVCSALCLLAIVSSYVAFTKADDGLYAYAIAFIVIGAAVGMFALK